MLAKSVKKLPRVPDGKRIYAIGDIHGRLDLLEELQAKIKADAKRCKHLEIIQIFLGDYVDRGSNSKEVVDFLIQPPPKKWKRICLKGNHESMVLKFLDKPQTCADWCRKGGFETLRSYGAIRSASQVSEDYLKIQNKFAKKLGKSHRKFFSDLRLSAKIGDYFFVHAGVRPGVALGKQVEEDLLWIRKEFIASQENFGKTIVHGHTPIEQPEIRFNRINIDTGAWMSDRLTCLVLEGKEQRFL